MEHSKKVLGIMSVVIILVLIITNSLLFYLLHKEKNKADSIEVLILSENHTYDHKYIVRDFIVDECNGSGVFYRSKTPYSPERLACHIEECKEGDYCKDYVRYFNFTDFNNDSVGLLHRVPK